MKYIITIDNPYYPEIFYCNSLTQSKIIKNKLLLEHRENGKYDVNVIVAEVIINKKIKTTC